MRCLPLADAAAHPSAECDFPNGVVGKENREEMIVWRSWETDAKHGVEYRLKSAVDGASGRTRQTCRWASDRLGSNCSFWARQM